MLIRKIEKQLALWKESKYALLVDGARQVGKTFILRKFASENFDNMVYINLFEQKNAVEVLRQSKNSDDFMFRLMTLVDNPFVPNRTVIFVDEIQELRDFDLITTVKFLVDKGDFRFMFSGSLLGVELFDIKSWPMGYMTSITMYPLDFEEFLWANNVNQVVIDRVREAFDKKTEVDDFVHTKMMDLFNKYLLVGGMPEAVNAFVGTNNLNQVAIAHKTIEQYNKKDISKYAKENERLRIKEIYDLMAEELNRKNKRFLMSDIKSKKRGDDISYSFSWLKQAGVAIPAYTALSPEVPLRINSERNLLKLFCQDVGLLTYMLMDSDIKIKILSGQTNVNFGAIYENVCAQLLNCHGFDKIYYFNSKTMGEVDFMVEYQGEVLPIEIKSGKDYTKHSALNNLLNKNQFEISQAFVFCNDNFQVDGKIFYFPIYMLEFLRKGNL